MLPDHNPALTAAPAAAPPRAAAAEAGERTAGGELAYLLAYPGDGFGQHLDEACARIAAELPAAAQHLERFARALRPLPAEEREELFTRTFDVNPICSLEIGWQLFGEEYHRGALLVRLRQELRLHGIEESSELPDHLTHVLSLLDRMAPEAAAEFARCCVAPAVDKMLAGFADQENPYADVLQAAVHYVQERIPADDDNQTRAAETGDVPATNLLPVIEAV